MDTHSDTVTLKELFEGSRFTIPEIQRDYAWNAKKEVSKLLEDLWKYHTVTDHKASPHYFVGTIIVYSGQEHSGDLQIMDGQQRISSITCLMSALKSHLELHASSASVSERKKMEKLVDEIEDTYLFELIKKKVVPKLRPKTEDAMATIRKMVQMDGESPDEAFEDQSKVIAKSKLFKALDYFYGRLYSLANEHNPESPISEMIKFYSTVNDQIVVTLTTTKTMGMAFQMFVSVNAGGKPLNSYDLLRGLLVAKSFALGIDSEVSEEIRYLNKNMKEIERVARSDTKVETCVRYWMEARHGKNIQRADVPDMMDLEIREFEEFSQFKSMIRELRRFATAYLSINDLRSAYFSSGWPAGYTQHRRILGFMESGGGWNANHMVLYSALHSSKASEQEIIAVMSAVEWVSIRGGWSQISNNLENVYPEFANKALYVDGSDGWLPEFVEALDGVLEKADINGFAHLENESLSESKSTVLLHKIRKSTKDPGPRTRTDNCNCCKYMPIGAPSPWNCRPEREDNGSITGLLGNWFLLKDISDKDISKFSQSPKPRVRQMLERANTSAEVRTLDGIKSRLYKDGTRWNTTDIRNRTRSLMEKLELEWPREFVIPK